MINLRLILQDQLNHSISSLSGIDKKNDVVIMSELITEFTYVKHHKKKIAFILSAMRHFAKELRDAKIKIDYTSLDNPYNTGSLKSEIQKAIQKHQPVKIIVTSPSEYRILKGGLCRKVRDFSQEVFSPLFIRVVEDELILK